MQIVRKKLCKHLKEALQTQEEVVAQLCQDCPDLGFCQPCYERH